jgi:translation initiation factor IF-3
LDLVEVAPNERPPVCRITDYGKWKYQQKKKLKKHVHEQQLKEVRLSAKTDQHDRSIKVARAREFLNEGHKVQFTMIFRGRERFHQDRGIAVFHAIIEEFAALAKVERPPRTEGRRMIMVLAPTKAPSKPAKPAEKPTEKAADTPPPGGAVMPVAAAPAPAMAAAVTPPSTPAPVPASQGGAPG